jgi:hypothetical protein
MKKNQTMLIAGASLILLGALAIIINNHPSAQTRPAPPTNLRIVKP